MEIPMYEHYFDCYKAVAHDNYPEQYGIKLLTPPYEGVIVTFGRFKINPTDAPDGIMFEYEIREQPETVTIQPKEFEDLLGGILLGILEYQFTKDDEAAKAASETE